MSYSCAQWLHCIAQGFTAICEAKFVAAIRQNSNLLLHLRTKVHEFLCNATIAKKNIIPTPARPNPTQCLQHNILAHAKERILIRLQRPCTTSDKRTLLGREMVEIGAPQSKSAPESKASYPADLSAGASMQLIVDLALQNPSLTRIFTRGSC